MTFSERYVAEHGIEAAKVRVNDFRKAYDRMIKIHPAPTLSLYKIIDEQKATEDALMAIGVPYESI